MSADTVRSAPLAIGDHVTLWGVPGIVDHIARSPATERSIVTVALSPRIRLRVAAAQVLPAGVAP